MDDGSRDGTGEVAAQHGAVVARHVINRGGGAALRTGYRLLADSGARIVVTLDADGQHLPSEMERLVEPVLSGEVAVAHGSRVLGEAEPNHYARELGIVFFNRMVSLITRTKVSDCSNGYRAVRARRPAAARPAPGAVPHLRVPDRGDQARHPGQGGPGDRRQPACTATPRSRPSSATGWGSRTRSSGPGCGRYADAASSRPTSSSGPGRPHLRGVRQVEVRAAAGADLDVELRILPQRGQRRSGSSSLAPVEDRRRSGRGRQHGADEEPDEERAPLAPPDEPGRDPEGERDEQILAAGHRPTLCPAEDRSRALRTCDRRMDAADRSVAIGSDASHAGGCSSTLRRPRPGGGAGRARVPA